MTTNAKTNRVQLTDRAASAAKADIFDTIVPQLFVRVRKDARSFALLTRFPGSPNPTRRTIGRVGVMTLAEARQTARDWMLQIKRGIDPAAELQRERDDNASKRHNSIETVIEAFIARRVIGGNSDKPMFRSSECWITNLRGVLVPMFGDLPVSELKATDVSTALEAIEKFGTDHGLLRLRVPRRIVKDGKETRRVGLLRPARGPKPAPQQARMLFVYLETVLRWAAGTGQFGIDASPLDRIKKEDRFGPVGERDRTLNDDELAAVWRATARVRVPYRQLYRMLILTGLRLSEVRDAQATEFDCASFDTGDWLIPAARMKGKNSKSGKRGAARPHRVPLTPLMRSVLKELPRSTRGPFLFSFDGGLTSLAEGGDYKQLLDREIAVELGKIEHFTNHDIRRTVRTRGGELGIPEDVGEAILAHRRPGIIGIYDRGERLEQRRDAHVMWGDFVLRLAGPQDRKVVRLRKVA